MTVDLSGLCVCGVPHGLSLVLNCFHQISV